MPKISPPHKDKTAYARRGRKLQIGPLDTLRALEDGLRVVAKVMAADGDLSGASANMKTLAWIKFRERELELRGLNMHEDTDFRFVSEDYAGRFVAEQEKNKAQAEEIAALREQVAALGGKERERPRPPRPSSLN
jgi:hypothetical protein